MSVEIEKIDKNNSKQISAFLDLPLKIYGDSPLVRNTIQKTKGLIQAPYDAAFYLVKEGNELAGRMSIYIHPGIKDPQGRPYGQVGLFEVIQDYNVFCEMMEFAKKELKGFNSFLFPFYISTWHHYRFIAEADFSFYFETPNKPYYTEFAKCYGVENIWHYQSIFSPDSALSTEYTKPGYEELLKKGFSFRDIDIANFDREISKVYELSIRAFPENLFYTHISFEEFRVFFLKTKSLVNKKLFTFCMYEGKEVAFMFTTLDYTPMFECMDLTKPLNKLKFMLNKNKASGYVIKSSAVLSEYRKAGVYSSLGCHQSLQMPQRAHEHVIGAFFYIKNYSPKPMKGVIKENHYELYSIKV